MSRKRAVQRKLHVKPAEGFAKEVGAALERYGRRGGALKEAARSLVRYAAQTAAMAGIDEAQFERLARAAYGEAGGWAASLRRLFASTSRARARSSRRRR